jgi:hypothetical protein
LIPAPDDPRIGSAALQLVFAKCRAFLCLRGVEVSMPMFYDYDAEERWGGYIGEFVIPLHRAIEPAVETILDAWFEGRPDRTVSLRVGEMETEARVTKQAASFLRRAQQLREAHLAQDEGCDRPSPRPGPRDSHAGEGRQGEKDVERVVA